MKEASNSQHEQMRNQLRRLTTLSHGIRSLQAKLHMLREESAKALDEHTPPCIPAASEGSAVPQADRHLHLPGAFESTKHEDLAEHSPRRTARDTKCDDEDKEHIEHSSNDADLRASSSRLHTAFDSIGQDLQQLTQTWSAGRAMFELSSSPPSSRRQSKRLSNYRLSLEARMSPVLSLTGTTVVDDGSPSIPLSRLFGRDASVSPISRDFGSRPLSCLSVSSAGADDSPASNAETDEDLRPALDAGSKKAMIEQVFEAVATPRTRLPHQRQARHQRHPTPLILLSPESRAQREKDELERRQKADLASASRNMVAELKSVICARSPDPIDAG